MVKRYRVPARVMRLMLAAKLIGKEKELAQQRADFLASKRSTFDQDLYAEVCDLQKRKNQGLYEGNGDVLLTEAGMKYWGLEPSNYKWELVE